MADQSPRSPLVAALAAHRTALAALGSYSLALCRRFGDPGSGGALARYEAALAHAIATRTRYDVLVREAIVREHMGSNGANGHGKQN